MRWHALAIVLLVLLTLVSRGRGARGRGRPAGGTHLELRPLYVKECAGVPNNALGRMETDYHMVGRTTIAININATVLRFVDRWDKLKIVIDKCDGQVSQTTCTNFRTLDFTTVCPTIMSPAMPWAKMVADLRPKASCPIKEGRYSLVNGTVNMDVLNAMSSTLQLEGPVWRFRGTVYDGQGVAYLCIDAAGEVFRVRNSGKG